MMLAKQVQQIQTAFVAPPHGDPEHPKVNDLIKVKEKAREARVQVIKIPVGHTCSCGGVKTGPAHEAREHLRDFTASTSLHGVRYIGELSRHPVERVMWLAVVLVFAVLGGMEVAKVWTRWRTSPVIMTFSQRPTHVSNIPFPAITICPENRVIRSALDLDKNFDTIKNGLLGKGSFPNAETKMKAEVLSLQCVKTQPTFELLIPANFTPTREHVLKQRKLIGPLEDVFVYCMVNGKEFNCTQYIRYTTTHFGACYSFNLLEDVDFYSVLMDVDDDPDRPPSLIQRSTWNLEDGYTNLTDLKNYPISSGLSVNRFSGFQVVLASDKREVQDKCAQLDDDNSEDYRVSMAQPGEYPDPTESDFFRVNAGSELEVSLQPRMVNTAPQLIKYPSETRGCYFPGERPLTLFKMYTRKNCEFECAYHIHVKYCKCYMNMFPLPVKAKFEMCSPQILIDGCGKEFNAYVEQKFSNDTYRAVDETGDAVFCGCLPLCTELQYSFHLSSATYKPPPSYKNSTTSKNLQYTMINVFYDSSTFQSRQRDELYGLTDFIASCGGLLGVFSGFSLVTLAEVCYFATLRLVCRIRERRRHSALVHHAH